ncbi:MAG: hypothetical protein GC154_16670 [bacterium]|nr:hypothetical protein [bacterium]
MNRLYRVVMVILACGLTAIGAATSAPLDRADYARLIQRQSRSVGNTRIIYQAVEYYFANAPEEERDDARREIANFQRLQRAKIAGTLAAEEQLFYNKSDEWFNNVIAQHKKRLETQPTDAVYTYSTDGVRIRQDVYRPEGNPTDHYYLFDGVNGCMVTPHDSRIRTGDFLAARWTDFKSFARFGSGLDRLFQPRSQYNIRLIEEDGVQKIIVESPTLQDREQHVEFTLLDSNPACWTQCDHVHNGKVFLRLTCGEFEEYGGLLVPRVVHHQKPYGESFRDDYALSLIKVETEGVEFPDGFFNPPPPETSVVQRMQR